jgi:hypothetical protein
MVQTSLPGRKRLDVEIGNGQRVLTDKVTPGLYHITHELGEKIIGLV